MRARLGGSRPASRAALISQPEDASSGRRSRAGKQEERAGAAAMASNAVSMLGLVRIPAAPLPAAGCAQHKFNAPGPLPSMPLGSLGRKAAAGPGEPLRQRLSNKSRLVASGYDYDAEPVLQSEANNVAQEAGEYIKGAATAVAEEVSGVKELKQSLVDSFYGTQRGLRASSDTRAEIVELISQLEARNPTPAPTEALSLLDGKWILAYTSFSELFPLLAAGNLPLVQVGEISQTIDSSALTVQNSVTFTGPLATTSFSASASFEVRSPKRVQIKFEEGIIGTPQLTDAIDIPESVEVLGRRVELSPIRSILTPLQDAASTIARTVSGQPPLKFSLSRAQSQSWLLTTFLDEDLRISKGDAGSVFVLIKEGSPLLLL